MSPSRSSARLGLLQISAAGILWGTGGLAVQLIRDRAPISVLVISAWRMGLAALVLMVAVGLATCSYQALYFAAIVAVGVSVGVLLSVACGAAYAAATSLGRPLAETTSPLVVTTVTSSVGAMGLLPLALVAGGPYVTGNAQALGLLVYLGLVPLALAYGLLYAGLRTVTGSAAVVATLLAVTGLEGGGEDRAAREGPAPL